MDGPLASLNSVQKFANDFLQDFKVLDILILNAGIMGHPHAMSEDNLELTFQVNYLSHFYLSHLLQSAMNKAIMPKIVSISSESHRFSQITNSEEFLAESCLNKVL